MAINSTMGNTSAIGALADLAAVMKALVDNPDFTKQLAELKAFSKDAAAKSKKAAADMAEAKGLKAQLDELIEVNEARAAALTELEHSLQSRADALALDEAAVAETREGLQASVTAEMAARETELGRQQANINKAARELETLRGEVAKANEAVAARAAALDARETAIADREATLAARLEQFKNLARGD